MALIPSSGAAALDPKDLAANLAAIDALEMDFDSIRSQEGANYERTHKYQGGGGVRVPAVIIKKFNAKPGAYSVSFEALVFRVDSALQEGHEKFVKTNADANEVYLELPLEDYRPPRENPPIVTQELRETMPKAVEIKSFESVTFGIPTENASILAEISPNDIVYLNGTSGRSAILRLKDGDTFIEDSEYWAVFKQVSSIEKTGLTMSHLWPAAQGLPTSYLKPNDQAYITTDPGSRYNRASSYVISSFPDPPDDDEQAREDAKVRFANQCGRTKLDSECLHQDGALVTSAAGGGGGGGAGADRTESPRARLTYTHLQWPPGTKYSEDARQLVSVGLTAYDEILGIFGIKDKPTWLALAPRIFSQLPAKWFGYVDTKETVTAFGGIGQSSMDFALQLFPTAFIPDMAYLCKRIGIPVTADFVKRFQTKPQGMLGGVRESTARLTRSNIVNGLPPVVPVTGRLADPTVTRHLLDMAESGSADAEDVPMFYAWVNFVASASNYDLVNGLTPEDGSLIAEALLGGGPAVITKVPGKFPVLGPIFKALKPEGTTVYGVVHAVCSNVVPSDVVMRNNHLLSKFILGPTAADAAQLEAPATSTSTAAAAAASVAGATIEEVDDDEDLFGDGGKEEESDDDDEEEEESDDDEEEEEDEDEEEEEEEEEEDSSSSSAAAAAVAAAIAANKRGKRKMDDEDAPKAKAKPASKAKAKAKKSRVDA